MSLKSLLLPRLLRATGIVPGLSPALGLFERRRRQGMLQHEFVRRPRVAAEIVPDRPVQAVDVEIAARLLAAHGAALRDFPVSDVGPPNDLWRSIEGRRKRFASILARGSAEELASYLCNVSRHDASHGITQGDIEFARIRRDRWYSNDLALSTKDSLVSLAEALGVMAVENPAQGPLGANLHADAETLVTGIERRLGVDVRPPDIDGGLFKLSTSRGLFGERDLNAIFTAHTVASALENHSTARICEIGAGSGRVAYWCHRFGLRRITLIDLPQVNVVQGYYLLRSLPEAHVTLYGEPEASSDDALRILPSYSVGLDHQPAYDLVLNQDSFPEMSPDTVSNYLRWVSASCQGRFMSINHESKPPYGQGLAHVSVPEAIAGHDGFRLRSRTRYWLRAGYVAEVYDVGP